MIFINPLNLVDIVTAKVASENKFLRLGALDMHHTTKYGRLKATKNVEITKSRKVNSSLTKFSSVRNLLCLCRFRVCQSFPEKTEKK